MKNKRFVNLAICLFVCLGMVQVIPSYGAGAISGNQNYDIFTFSQKIFRDTMGKKVKKFKKEWNKKINQLDKKIKQDEKKLKSAKTENKEKLNEEIQDMKVKRDQLKQEVAGAGNKTAAQWEEFKSQVSEQYDSLSTKVKGFFDNTF